MNEFYTMPVALTGNAPEKKREEIREYFHKTYTLFERIFDVLVADDVFYRKSEPTRHPMIFYFGHSATFFINKLILGKVISERVNPDFESMFAIGVDEMNWDDLTEDHYDWPEVSIVRKYRNAVRDLIDNLISELPLSLPITDDSPWWIIMMGIEHERIHIETSSVLHRQMPFELICDSELFPICEDSGTAPENELVDIEGGLVCLGKERDHHLYGWDNEYGRLELDIAPFKAARYLTSNGEFMPFVLDGGYSEARFWDDEGLLFLKHRKAEHPVFWIPDDDGSYKFRTMTRIIDMPMDWPAEVNNLEAKAFCRWKSEKDGKHYRLLTEPEWYHLYERAGINDVPELDDSKANINLRFFASSVPVNKFLFGELYDVIGNVWQWTETAIDGYKGFEIHPIYDDFSVPTFDGRHNLIKGGSWISTGNEIMKHSRYAFRRHFYQHAGFRYVEAEEISEESSNIYETDVLMAQYCEFQYGESVFGVENFAQKCANLAIEYTKDISQKTALDLGCAAGRASFELAKAFDKVIGVDFSARFIQLGVAMQENGKIKYQRTEEGSLVSIQEHSLEEYGLGSVKDKVEFWQGDACNLKPQFSGYDLIMATNLIDRLYEPKMFLDKVHERINVAGFLIITSPYTWLDEYTKPEQWLGGFRNGYGEEVHTIDSLTEILGKHFELLDRVDVPFVIRETSRKFQHTISEMTVWQKKE
jgi:5-histidylcysteine sulfoxide synthase/putative 4-mercaptohistidine N1-methyltranferase